MSDNEAFDRLVAGVNTKVGFVDLNTFSEAEQRALAWTVWVTVREANDYRAWELMQEAFDRALSQLAPEAGEQS